MGVAYRGHPNRRSCGWLADAAEMQDGNVTAKLDHWDEVEGQTWTGSTQVIIPALRLCEDASFEEIERVSYWSEIPPGRRTARIDTVDDLDEFEVCPIQVATRLHRRPHQHPHPNLAADPHR